MIIIQKVFSIFAQNLAYYNEGSIEGGWLDLPQSSKVIDDYLKNVVVNSDTIETMKLLQDESIHLTFTSPPYYNARDYSIYPY